MDSLCFDGNKEDIEMKSAEELPASDSSGLDDKFGDPEVTPRVGDEYQANIPSFVAVPCRSPLIKETGDSKITVNMPEPFSLGLPIPLMWAHCKFESGCENSERVTIEGVRVISENECPKVKVEFQNTSLGQGKNVGGFSNFRSFPKCSETDNGLFPEPKTELNWSRGKYLLPGLWVDQSWTDTAYDSFLLGLYIFGKNLNFLKRFVVRKSIGDILYFYYGKFYGSKAYRRWSECRKLRTRRCISGQKIFTGWRQQELLSRIFPHVSEQCQTMLIEVSRRFVEGMTPFEDYIFVLKNAAGIELLISAVGIGKGKQDLTSTAVEPTKTNHISVRSEIPVGKACSSLTSADIIKFLTGNFRLSKARSNDLFREAVWPRLLAKGWHSEQPMDHVVSGSKQSLVFLIPGVKKFSRRKLVKGNHYFDSISDVLNKVASEPRLLENENKATDGNVDRENRPDKCELDGLSSRRQFRYLQPHSSKSDQDLIKFTIVDTSTVHDLHQRKVRQLRSLPFQTTSISTISSSSSESEQDALEDSEDEVEQDNSSSPVEDRVGQADSSYLVEDQVEQANSSNPIEELSDKGVSIDSSDYTLIPEALNATTVEVENHGPNPDPHDDDRSRETNEHQFIQKVASDCPNYFPLTACNHGESSHCAENNTFVGRKRKFDLNEPISPSNLHEASGGMVLSLDSEVLSFPSNAARGSPNRGNEESATDNNLVGEVAAEKSETRMLIDLNFPQVPPELGFDMNIPSSTVIEQNDSHCENTSCSPSELTQLDAVQESPDNHKDQQSIAVNRRQSTRNRPLTTKALEALEYSFLNSKRKRKSTESSDSGSKSRCLHVSNGTVVSASCDDGIGNPIADTRAKEENISQA